MLFRSIPPFRSPHFRKHSICLAIICKDLSGCIYKVLCMRRVAPKTADRLNDVSVTYDEGLVWMIFECKIMCLPFPCMVRNIVKNLVQRSCVVV